MAPSSRRSRGASGRFTTAQAPTLLRTVQSRPFKVQKQQAVTAPRRKAEASGRQHEELQNQASEEAATAVETLNDENSSTSPCHDSSGEMPFRDGMLTLLLKGQAEQTRQLEQLMACVGTLSSRLDNVEREVSEGRQQQQKIQLDLAPVFHWYSRSQQHPKKNSMTAEENDQRTLQILAMLNRNQKVNSAVLERTSETASKTQQDVAAMQEHITITRKTLLAAHRNNSHAGTVRAKDLDTMRCKLEHEMLNNCNTNDEHFEAIEARLARMERTLNRLEYPQGPHKKIIETVMSNMEARGVMVSREPLAAKRVNVKPELSSQTSPLKEKPQLKYRPLKPPRVTASGFRVIDLDE